MTAAKFQRIVVLSDRGFNHPTFPESRR